MPWRSGVSHISEDPHFRRGGVGGGGPAMNHGMAAKSWGGAARLKTSRRDGLQSDGLRAIEAAALNEPSAHGPRAGTGLWRARTCESR
jgi:hypothetical protein